MERRQKRYPNLRRGATKKKKPAAKNSGRAASTTRGRPFVPGMSGNPKGRRPGVPNKATKEIKLLAQSILEDPYVQERMLYDARRGRLAPPVMIRLFDYAYGRPKETLRLEGLEKLEVVITDDIGDESGLPDPAAADA